MPLPGRHWSDLIAHIVWFDIKLLISFMSPIRKQIMLLVEYSLDTDTSC